MSKESDGASTRSQIQAGVHIVEGALKHAAEGIHLPAHSGGEGKRGDLAHHHSHAVEETLQVVHTLEEEVGVVTHFVEKEVKELEEEVLEFGAAVGRGFNAWSRWVIHNKVYEGCMLAAIFLSSIVLAVDEPHVWRCSILPADHPDQCILLGEVLLVSNYFFTVLFALEAIFKVPCLECALPPSASLALRPAAFHHFQSRGLTSTFVAVVILASVASTNVTQFSSYRCACCPS